jgi:hypothetical protein
VNKLLTVSKVNEQGNLSTHSYKMKCKQENQVKKAELRVVGKRRTRFFVESTGYKTGNKAQNKC